MDPDEALRLLREYASEVTNARDDDLREDPDGECWSNELHLAMAFFDLDEWLSKGGFLPDAWNSGALTVPVKDLGVNCSYLTKPENLKRGGFALSDTCQQPADTVVVTVSTDPPGVTQQYRCPEHRGLVRGDEPGDVKHHIPPRH